MWIDDWKELWTNKWGDNLDSFEDQYQNWRECFISEAMNGSIWAGEYREIRREQIAIWELNESLWRSDVRNEARNNKWDESLEQQVWIRVRDTKIGSNHESSWVLIPTTITVVAINDYSFFSLANWDFIRREGKNL
jgi:hypothetical protein